MKILVIGGMHGNEPLGLKVVKLLQNKPINNVSVVIANEKAVEKKCRFIIQDLNRSFPGNIKSNSYEKKRAAELLEFCNQHDLILDFHNTSCQNNDCTFVGNTASKFLFDISSWLGLKQIIVADYDCINKYNPNCLSIEISLNSKLTNPLIWYGLISRLVAQDSIPAAKGIKKYKFIYRITLEDRDSLKLDKRNLQAFKIIDRKLAKALGVQNPAFPIFIGDSFTPYNYGGLLNKIK